MTTNKAIPMELDTFYRIDPETGNLIACPFTDNSYPLDNSYQAEPSVFLDVSDNMAYISGANFDHLTFANTHSFGAPAKFEDGDILSFIPFIPVVEALLNSDAYRAYKNVSTIRPSYLYLSKVYHEVTDESIGGYYLIWATF